VWSATTTTAAALPCIDDRAINRISP
jgi:hypothetical protein